MLSNVLAISSLFSAVLAAPVLEERGATFPVTNTVIATGTKVGNSPIFNFGSSQPSVAIVAALKANCLENACPTTVKIPTGFAADAIEGVAPSNAYFTLDLVAEWADATYKTEDRNVILESVGMVYKAVETSKLVNEPTERGQSGQMLQWFAPSFIGFTQETFQTATSRGSLSTIISMQAVGTSDSSLLCSTLAGLVTAVAGPIGDLAAAFFGVVAAADCTAGTS